MKEVLLSDGKIGLVVREGTFLYDGAIRLEFRIVKTPINYGDWNEEGSREVENGTFFGCEFGTTTKPALGQTSEADNYPEKSLDAAIAYVLKMCPSIVWME